MVERITADELVHWAHLSEVIERERVRYEGQLRRPLTQVDLTRFRMWEAAFLEQAWADFHRPPPLVSHHRR